MPEQPINGNGSGKERESAPNNGRADESSASQQRQTEPAVVREVTQTDQLNKRLLSSLLERMNKGDERVNKFLESSGSEDQDLESDF